MLIRHSIYALVFIDPHPSDGVACGHLPNHLVTLTDDWLADLVCCVNVGALDRTLRIKVCPVGGLDCPSGLDHGRISDGQKCSRLPSFDNGERVGDPHGLPAALGFLSACLPWWIPWRRRSQGRCILCWWWTRRVPRNGPACAWGVGRLCSCFYYRAIRQQSNGACASLPTDRPSDHPPSSVLGYHAYEFWTCTLPKEFWTNGHGMCQWTDWPWESRLIARRWGRCRKRWSCFFVGVPIIGHHCQPVASDGTVCESVRSTPSSPFSSSTSTLSMLGTSKMSWSMVMMWFMIVWCSLSQGQQRSSHRNGWNHAIQLTTHLATVLDTLFPILLQSC